MLIWKDIYVREKLQNNTSNVSFVIKTGFMHGYADNFLKAVWETSEWHSQDMKRNICTFQLLCPPLLCFKFLQEQHFKRRKRSENSKHPSSFSANAHSTPSLRVVPRLPWWKWYFSPLNYHNSFCFCNDTVHTISLYWALSGKGTYLIYCCTQKLVHNIDMQPMFLVWIG